VSGLRTEFDFILPKGLVDDDGTLHREGTMRLATARDELEPLRDPKVRDADDPYLTIVVLSRVVVNLGTKSRVTPRDIEGLFAADLAYLQDFYSVVNFGTEDEIEALVSSVEETRSAARPRRGGGSVIPDPVDEAPRGAVSSFDGGDTDDDDDDDDDDDAPVVTAPRRARIEEVKRSGGPVADPDA
jgi:hypothetical protein